MPEKIFLIPSEVEGRTLPMQPKDNAAFARRYVRAQDRGEGEEPLMTMAPQRC